jgi:[ribosomal protein S5]-alanine N-acetyltransferase
MIDSEILPTIEGERVCLRWLNDDDVNALFSIFSDPKVMQYWSSLPLEDTKAAQELLAVIRDGFQRKTLFQWGISLYRDNTVIGTCTLYHIDTRNRRAEIGYALGSKYWKNGFMQEALRLLIDYCFNSLNFHRLEADIDPLNAASIKLVERLGFQKEGYLRERWLVGGNAQDSLIYGLLKNDWLKIRKGFM